MGFGMSLGGNGRSLKAIGRSLVVLKKLTLSQRMIIRDHGELHRNLRQALFGLVEASRGLRKATRRPRDVTWRGGSRR